MSNSYESPSFQAEPSRASDIIQVFVHHLHGKFPQVSQLMGITPILPSPTWCIYTAKPRALFAGKTRKAGFQKILTPGFLHLSALYRFFQSLSHHEACMEPSSSLTTTCSDVNNGNSLFLKLSLHQMTLKLTKSQVNLEGEEKKKKAWKQIQHNHTTYI